MRIWILQILVVLITLASIKVSLVQVVDFNYPLEDAISSEPLLNDVPFNNPSKKNNHDFSFITFNFVQTFLFSNSEEKHLSNQHYLPIYVLIRLKEFFLII